MTFAIDWALKTNYLSVYPENERCKHLRLASILSVHDAIVSAGSNFVSIFHEMGLKKRREEKRDNSISWKPTKHEKTQHALVGLGSTAVADR